MPQLATLLTRHRATLVLLEVIVPVRVSPGKEYPENKNWWTFLCSKGTSRWCLADRNDTQAIAMIFV